MPVTGVPASITIESVKDWIKPRVSAKRLAHIEGVVKVCKRLCQGLAVDPYLACLTGWLHDACKEMKASDLLAQAKQFGLALDPLLEAHGHLLHGPVAAETVKRELNITNVEVLNAIAEHTLGAAPMSQLSKIVFLADCLDETRSADYTAPIWEALDPEGKMDLDAAIVVASDLGLKFLIEDGKPIHPKTVMVRNFYLDIIKARS